jgi:hypothetical protein
MMSLKWGATHGDRRDDGAGVELRLSPAARRIGPCRPGEVKATCVLPSIPWGDRRDPKDVGMLVPRSCPAPVAPVSLVTNASMAVR